MKSGVYIEQHEVVLFDLVYVYVLPSDVVKGVIFVPDFSVAFHLEHKCI